MSISKLLVFLLGGIIALQPVSAAAANPQCQVFNDHRQKISQVMTPKESTLASLRVKNKYDNLQNITTSNQKIANKRKALDKDRTEIIKKLTNKSATKQQKSAIADYKKNIEAATKTYREQSNAATHFFNSSLDNLFQTQRDGTDSRVQSLKKQYDVAKTLAIAECEKKGVQKATESFTANSVSFENNYKELPIISVADVQASLDTIRKTYQRSEKDAQTKLNESMKSVRFEVKKAFGNNSKNILN